MERRKIRGLDYVISNNLYRQRMVFLQIIGNPQATV